MHSCDLKIGFCYAAVLQAALRVLPVRLSVCPVRARNFKIKTKKRRKVEIGIDISQGADKWNVNFQLKRSKVKVTGRQKPPKCGVMFT